MRDRWREIGLLAAVLCGIAVVARLVARFYAGQDVGRQETVAWVAYGAVGLTLAVAAVVWGRHRPIGRVAADLGGAALVGCLFSVLVGPFISGGSPFAGGPGVFFGMIWLYGGVAIGSALLALLVLIALGQDHRSQALKRFAETQRTRPRRPVRR
ncbi:MAG: hypothetical protein FWJ93_07830 [Micromonosporaceae bacterium]